MKKISFAAALAGVMALSGTASAATLLYDETITPQSSSGSTTFYDADNDFSESWDISSVTGTIEYFELTLEVSGATGEYAPGLPFQGENWDIRVQGSATGSASLDPANEADDYKADIVNGTNTYIIDASTDTGSVDAFAQSVATGTFTLWLAEESLDSYLTWTGVGTFNPSITISSATLKVYGEVSPIPLPAGAPLLLAGLGGLAMLRRRKRA